MLDAIALVWYDVVTAELVVERWQSGRVDRKWVELPGELGGEWVDYDPSFRSLYTYAPSDADLSIDVAEWGYAVDRPELVRDGRLATNYDGPIVWSWDETLYPWSTPTRWEDGRPVEWDLREFEHRDEHPLPDYVLVRWKQPGRHDYNLREELRIAADGPVTILVDPGHVAGDAIVLVDWAGPCDRDVDGQCDRLCDLNLDGACDIFDFIELQNRFADLDPSADLDGDGFLTIFDYLKLGNLFEASE